MYTGTYFKIYHILVQKVCLDEYKQIKVSSCKLSEHCAMELEWMTEEISQNVQKPGKFTILS